MFITVQEVLQGRDTQYPLTPELKANLDKLLIAVNKLRAFYGKPLVVSSGYRPAPFNKAAGGAKSSSHLTCEAVDFRDDPKEAPLAKWCLENLNILESCGLYLEDPAATKGWIHVQTRAPRSGNRVFKP
jgi:hypothetical protein